jgi:hypothetical protein
MVSRHILSGHAQSDTIRILPMPVPQGPLGQEDALKALDELFGAIDKYRTHQGFTELLTFMKTLPTVGAYNALLLHIQRPGATYVATVNGWRDHGRQVNRQANPLVTLKPFGPVEFVYDIDDTTGPELPDAVRYPFRTRGVLSQDVFDRVAKNAQHDCVAILESKFAAQLAGRVSGDLPNRAPVLLANGKNAALVVEINSSLTVEAKFATLAHELAHIYCGHLGVPKGAWWARRTVTDLHVREFEAECVAWIVCARHGIDPGSYRYLNGYLGPGRSIPEISLNEVFVAAGHIESLASEKFRRKPVERVKENYSGVGSGVLSEVKVPEPPSSQEPTKPRRKPQVAGPFPVTPFPLTPFPVRTASQGLVSPLRVMLWVLAGCAAIFAPMLLGWPSEVPAGDARPARPKAELGIYPPDEIEVVAPEPAPLLSVRGKSGRASTSVPAAKQDAPQIVESRRLPPPLNGTLLRAASRRGLGTLEISNGTSSDAAVLLVPNDDEADVAAIYIRAASQAVLSGIAPREYRIKFMLGENWLGESFSENAEYSEFERIVTFREQRTETAQHYDAMSITLNAVIDGNARTKQTAPFQLTP